MPRPKTDRPPPHPKVRAAQLYLFRNRTRTAIPSKLFLKTLVSPVNSPMLVVILPLNPIDPDGPCLG